MLYILVDFTPQTGDLQTVPAVDDLDLSRQTDTFICSSSHVTRGSRVICTV